MEKLDDHDRRGDGPGSDVETALTQPEDGERRWTSSDAAPSIVDVDAGPDVAPSPVPGDDGEVAALLDRRDGGERYAPVKLLGRGGMGEVVLCKDHAIGREVAVKKIGAARPTRQRRRRFVREARVQGQLEHPSVVPVHDVGVSADGELYLTMKRVRGVSLADVLRGLRSGDDALAQRYSRRRLLTVLGSVCMAVHFAHQKGVVHRDLKPSNVMLGDFGEVYVLDWGLAALRRAPDLAPDPAHDAIDGGGGAATLAGGVLGTPGYMAPEQIEDPSGVDARADVYSLGAILFELLTLERMHGTRKLADVLVSTLETDGASPASRAEGVPPELDRLCHAATRRHRDARVASAKELAAAIDAYLDGDRDLAYRRELARTHVTRARDALAAGHATGADEARARTQAMREVAAALGLDPNDGEARQMLIRLIAEPPAIAPAEAEAAMHESRRAAYRLAARSALVFYASYVLYLPLLLWMGVRDWGLFAFGWITIAGCAAATFVVQRRPPKRLDVPLAHLALSTFTVAAVSVLFGPFILVPMLALGNSVVYIATIGYRVRLVTLAGCVAVVGPAALGFLGVVPWPYRFDGGAWTVLPTVFHVSPVATPLFLLVAVVGTVAPACWFVAKLRTAYAEAERRLQLQAWQLRQIVSDDAHFTQRTNHPAPT